MGKLTNGLRARYIPRRGIASLKIQRVPPKPAVSSRRIWRAGILQFPVLAIAAKHSFSLAAMC